MSDQNKWPQSPPSGTSPQSSPSSPSPHSPQTSREVSETAAKLALRSAADNQNSKTGRHLTQFSQNITQKLNADMDSQKDKSRKSSTKDPERDLINPLWNITTRLFSSNQIKYNAKTDNNVDNDSALTNPRQTEIVIQTEDKNMSAKSYLSSRKVNSSEVSNQKESEIIEMDGKASPPKQNSLNPTPRHKPSTRVLREKSSGLSLDQSSVPQAIPSNTPPEPDKIDSLDWENLTVEVRNIGYSYQSKSASILKRVNMSIPKGSIYGLLGPSGCGKTTLLRIVLGRLRPHSGNVLINGKKPGDPKNNIPGVGVGFMPQELALYEKLTIKEALKYFASIYSMKKDIIYSRIKFLVDFLDLPEPTRKIQFLSGGQQRRVSLAIALVHSPPLLILDEPTVGVDPLIREKIWEHLVVLSKDESISILITTHYIEEARRAHIVSLMRHGNILVEHSPNFLLKHFEVPNLEEVFLKVCRFDSNGAEYTMPKNYIDSRPAKKTKKPKLSNNNLLSIDLGTDLNKSRKEISEEKERVLKSMRKNQFPEATGWHKLRALLSKNYILIKRNKPLLAFQLLLPTIQLILFCLCIGVNPYDLKIAVYNQELENTEKHDNWSLEFINQIDKKTLIIESYHSKHLAIESVKESETYGALIFHKEFSTALMQRFIYSVTHDAIDNTTIDNSTIKYYGDFSGLMVSQSIVKALLIAEQKFQHVMIAKYNKLMSRIVNPRTVDPIVEFVDPPVYGTLEPSFRDFMVPGMILAITYILAVGLTALTFVIERKGGQLERTVVAGVKIYQILFAQLIIQLVILCLQTFLVMTVTFLIFKIHNNGSYIMIVLITLMQGLAGMSFGLVISSICNDEQTATMLSLGSFYPYLILSGIIWPLEGMPFGIRQFSYFLPQTLSVISLRNIMLKGWSFFYTYVWLGYLSTIAWIIIFIITATIISSLRNR